MSQTVIPSNSVEFETLTTLPEWGKNNSNPDMFIKDKNGKVIGFDPYRALLYFTQDERLANINPKLHDLNFIWSYLATAGQILLLRKGKFKEVFVSVLLPVVSTLETSQSIGMAFRRNARTVHHEQRFEEKNQGGGFLGLGKKKNTGY